MATSKKATPKKAIQKKAAPKKAAPIVKTEAPKAIKNNPTAVFNIDEINEILKAVHLSNVNELKLEKGDFKITIRQGINVVSAPSQVVHSVPAHVHAPATVAAPAPTAAPVAAPPPASTSDDHSDLVVIKSPMIGTFYRASGPGKPIFVNVGDEIKVGQVLCIVEAMKLFNEIESEISGKIVKVLADDTTPVEYDQPLFLVQPS